MYVFAILCLLSSVNSYQQWKTIYDKINQDPEFSGYRTMIKGNKDAMLNLLYNNVTVFVPENDAFSRYDGFFTSSLIQYHMTTEQSTLKQLTYNNSLQSADEFNPPLWVSVVPDGYFINNAKIIEKKSNYVAAAKRNQHSNQVLHVVDRVLDPQLQTPYSNPSAYDFLENFQHWKLGKRKVTNFFTRIQYVGKEDLYRKPGFHTFFVPIDDKMDDHRLNSIDSYVIEGHIVPNQVLFTRPCAKNFIYETGANGDYIYIVLSIHFVNGRYFVKSFTVLGNSDHKKGEVLTEIVKSDIPVSNGVVHLISKPLAVFDRELQPFPYLSVLYKVSSDPFLNITYHIGRENRLNRLLKRQTGMYTYFAPKDSAWRGYSGYDKFELEDILSRHLVVAEGRFTMSKLIVLSKNSNGTILESLGGPMLVKVVFSNGTYWVVWGENWVKVSRSDYQCSDGVVHVVDGIFAPPKMATERPKASSASLWKMLKDAVM